MAELRFHGAILHSYGELPRLGSQAPDFNLTNSQLKDFCLADFPGKRKLLLIVPSLDTPTCKTATRKFNEKAARFENTVTLVISADLPFAQDRFCCVEGVKHLQTLSTFRSSFARDYGVELIDGPLAGLTARAILVLNETDQVIYARWITEITEEPDYQEVFDFLLKTKIDG